jgi:hypothetical protein
MLIAKPEIHNGRSRAKRGTLQQFISHNKTFVAEPPPRVRVRPGNGEHEIAKQPSVIEDIRVR